MSAGRLSAVILSAAVAALGGCGGPAGPSALDDPEALVATVWEDYDRWYAFFPAQNLDWPAIGAAYRDSASRAQPGRPAAALVGRMIGRLGDAHADLTTPFGTFGGWPSQHQPHFDWQVIRGYFAQPERQTVSGRLVYATMQGNVGYLLIDSFGGNAWRDELDQAFAALAGVSAFVIDIRLNGGGSEDFARDVAARFCDVERVYRTARFRDGPAHTDLGPPVPFSIRPATTGRVTVPVAVVTGRRNASAAEDFVLMMRVLPTAVTVGDTTRGVGSYPMLRALPNGWRYRVPQSQQATPEGLVYNWIGLPPRIPVAWDASVVAAGRDPYIDAALAALAAARGSP